MTKVKKLGLSLICLCYNGNAYDQIEWVFPTMSYQIRTIQNTTHGLMLGRTSECVYTRLLATRYVKIWSLYNLNRLTEVNNDAPLLPNLPLPG